MEDEDNIRDMQVMILENAGMNIQTVFTVEEDQPVLMELSIELMLLDWMLP